MRLPRTILHNARDEWQNVADVARSRIRNVLHLDLCERFSGGRLLHVERRQRTDYLDVC